MTGAGACNAGLDTGSIFFQISNSQGAEYRIIVVVDGVQVQDETGTVPSQSFKASSDDVPNGTPISATLFINDEDYHFGPIVLSEVNGVCEDDPAVHDIHATVDFLCIEGDPTINLTVDNDGDYTEPMSGMFVDESFDTELGAGMSTNGQKVVAAGGHYEYSVMSGQTTLADDEGTMPDVCETGGDEASSGGLPETGSSQTLLAPLAGLLLALGAGLVRFTTRPELVWAEGSDDTDLV